MVPLQRIVTVTSCQQMPKLSEGNQRVTHYVIISLRAVILPSVWSLPLAVNQLLYVRCQTPIANGIHSGFSGRDVDTKMILMGLYLVLSLY